MATSFARLGYRNAANNFEAVNLRAQDVIDISGVSSEDHNSNTETAHGAAQAATANSIARRSAGGALIVGAPRAGAAGANDAVRRTDMDAAVSGIVAGLQFQASWNALTNTPTLPTTPTVQSQYWIVTAAGTQFGLTFAIGDWIVAGATSWILVPVTAAIANALQEHLDSTAAHEPQNVGAIPVDNIGAATGGTLPVVRGGTNRTSQAAGNINYATSPTATGVIAAPNATEIQVMVHPNQAVATPPTWRRVAGDAPSLRNDMGLGAGTGMLTPAEIGLGNVDNTSDANKPVSTAQQTAIDNVANGNTGELESTTAAATAAKTVTLPAGVTFVRRQGSTVYVRFTIANTALNPSLQIGTTPAAPIQMNNAALGVAATARQLMAGVLYGFVFDGTNWELIVPASAMPTMGLGWGTMTTAAATIAKVGTLAGYTRRTGSEVTLRWDTTPTAMSTLNVNATGAANVFHAGVQINTANGNLAMLTGGRTYKFVFDGTQWQLLNPAIEAVAPLDAAFVSSGAAMQALNLRTGALVLMEVQNVTISAAADISTESYNNSIDLDLADAELEPCDDEPVDEEGEHDDE